MKKKWLILTITLITFVVMSEKVLAPPYSVVVVDPGHGGPGAWKYGPNGDYHGTCGPFLKLSEQWVNLQVGLKLKDLIYYMGGVGFPVIMTRWTEQAENLPSNYEQAMWKRVGIANYGSDGSGYPVTQYISVHHNYPLSKQGTEVWWCSNYKTDHDTDRVNGYWRPAYMDSLLAMKTQFRLLDLWDYDDRCLTQCEPGSGSSFCCDNDYFVLRNTIMPSAISEASSLADSIQESLFDNPNTGHGDSEAVALFDGWYSHADNNGIAIIRNSYSLGSDGNVVIAEWPCDDGDTVSSPYIRCWLMGEHHCLVAITPQNIQGYQYSFHHWTHLDRFGGQIGDDYYYPEWYITVPPDLDYHRYVAYFTGGPYSAQLVSPNGWETWYVTEQETIKWNASLGADSTTIVYIYIDRNSGNSGYPEYLGAAYAKYWTGFIWTVAGPVSPHCRIKIVAKDIAGDSAWDISNDDFSITGSGDNPPVIDTGMHCKYPQQDCNHCIHYGESFTMEVHAHDPDHDDMYYEWHTGPWGGHFSNGQHNMTTAQNWVVYTAPMSKETEDFLSVAVNDVRGGQTWNSGYLGIFDAGYSCICGDANYSGQVELGDVVQLVAYLYKGHYDWIPDPILRADVNNNCNIDLGDIVYLISYLYKFSGLPPVCRWICSPAGLSGATPDK